LINKIPLEIEPPSPMPAPPLRRKPTPSPQLGIVSNEDSSLRLYIDGRWN